MSLKTYIKGMKLFVVSSIAASGKTTLVDYVTEKFDLYKLKTYDTFKDNVYKIKHEFISLLCNIKNRLNLFI